LCAIASALSHHNCFAGQARTIKKDKRQMTAIVARPNVAAASPHAGNTEASGTDAKICEQDEIDI